MKIRLKCHSTVVIQNHTLSFLPTAGDLIFGINIHIIFLIDLAVCSRSFHPSEMIHLGKQIGLRHPIYFQAVYLHSVEGMLKK